MAAEGSSNNKFIEIFNPTCDEIDLTEYAYPSCSNGCATEGTPEYWNDFDDGATVASGDYYVICHPSADDEIQAYCDETYSYLSNGDDVLTLVKGDAQGELAA